LHFLYNLLIHSAEKILPATGIFSNKMKLFTEGRKDVFEELSRNISSKDQTIWFHAASLGEYEQAVPVIEQVKKTFPGHKIILSFFSPSGYEVKKNSSLANVVTYLPLDTPENANKFLELVHPEWAIFIKYEFWPNFLEVLKKGKTKTILVSGVFREDQIFFQPYGKWMRPYLGAFEYFFLQDEKSKLLLNKLGFHNASVSGDTRFDRVHSQLQQDNQLDFMEEFKDGKTCLVAGSTWPEDDGLLVEYINQAPNDVKFIIAPHALKRAKIDQLQEQIKVMVVRFSEKEAKDLSKFQVLILDTIGLLTKVYSYADLAYVGGAAGDTGLHNVLEPAAFGVPVIIGKNFTRFPEAIELHQKGGLFSVDKKEELKNVLNKLLMDTNFRRETGAMNKDFVRKNRGATTRVMDYFLNFEGKEE